MSKKTVKKEIVTQKFIKQKLERWSPGRQYQCNFKKGSRIDI